jgi:hypothetical protein
LNSEDYAIVVGISKYPGLGKGPNASADLQASETDAEGIYHWLADPIGGGLPRENVSLILTGQFPPPIDIQDVEPQGQRIRDEFKRLNALAEESEAAGQGRRVGRRLYIYMSGHGFSPKRSQGALYTANATPIDPLNSFASGWLEWFQDNAYFQEYVLWLDCCMDREFTVIPEPIFRPRGVFQQAGPTFIGFAAHRPLKAVERPIAEDSGKIHGVFTWTLLRGLKGGAVNPETGEVTGRSLGDYIINAMKSYLRPEDLANPEISKEPDVPRADARLILAKNIAGQEQPVTFRFPPECENEVALIWSGNPPQPHSTQISGGEASKGLNVGLHVVEVPAAGFRQGFEVVGGRTTEVVVSARHVPVQAAPAGMTFALSVSPGDPTAQIFVVDHRLALKNQGKRSLATGLDFGLYKVKVRVGRESHESIFLLDRDVTMNSSSAQESVSSDQGLNLALPRPQLASAAPLSGTTMTHEFHLVAGASLAQEQPIRPVQLFGDVEGPASAEIRIMARVWTGPSGGSPEAKPWEGVELADSDGRLLLGLSDLPIQHPDSDPFVTARVEVVPGPYFLRQRLRDGRQLEQSLIVPLGWAVEVFMLAVAKSGAEPAIETSQHLSLDRRTVLMRRLAEQQSLDTREDEVLELARIALVDERHVLNDELENLLFHQFQNPLASIIGAHLLIMETEHGVPNSGERLRILDAVVPKLRSLVGTDHPDVQAISLCCPSNHLHAFAPFQVPPMLEQSWKLIVKATESRSDLVPDSLWGRVHAAVKHGGYFVWARDSTTQQAHLRRLTEWARVTAYGETEIREAQAPLPMTSAQEAVFVHGDEVASAAATAATPSAFETALLPEISNLALQVGIPTGALNSLLQQAGSKQD